MLFQGLHIPPSGSKQSILQQETRKRVWACLIACEAGCSVTFGRPFGLGTSHLIRMAVPLNVNDEVSFSPVSMVCCIRADIVLATQQITVASEDWPSDSSDITLYTSLIAQAHMAKITSSVHDSILCAHPAPSLKRIQRYDASIIEAFHELPVSFQHLDPNGPWHHACAITLWRIRDFRAILYRPVLLAAAWDARRQKQLSAGVKEAIRYASIFRMLSLWANWEFAFPVSAELWRWKT